MPDAVLTPSTRREPRTLSRRDVRWVARRCSHRGHVVAVLDSPVAERFGAWRARSDPEGATGLLRCLRCGLFLDPDSPGADVALRLGTADSPASLSTVPLVLRGSHGRKFALLRLLAVERGVRGLFLIGAALAAGQLATGHAGVLKWITDLATAAQPLAHQLGWDLDDSGALAYVQGLLNHTGGVYIAVAWLLAAYGVLQIVEGIGLWGGWRWAEYLAAVATTLFIPLELYEIIHHATVLKVGALVVNVAAVAYLVFKGHLFGVRGGHEAYRVEMREATLLADELHATGLDSADLTSHAVV